MTTHPRARRLLPPVVPALLGLALAWPAPSSHAQQPPLDPLARAGVEVFADGSPTTIWSPRVGAAATLPGNFRVTADWTADVISSASVDVVTAATSAMTELRQQVGVGVVREDVLPDTDVEVGYTFSTERDAYSSGGHLTLSRGLLQDQIELALSYALSYNRLGLPDEPTAYWRPLWVHSIDADVVVALDRSTFAELVWSTFYNDGYQESPYRRVPVTWRSQLVAASWLPEEVPETRWRNAVTLRVRHKFGRMWIGSASYRFYVDDWGVWSHTAELDLRFQPAERLTFGVHERATTQTAADFYRERYEHETTLRTRDRRLGPHLSNMAGAVVLLELGPIGPIAAMDLRLGLDLVAWRYDHFLAPVVTTTGNVTLAELGWIVGSVASLGIEVRP